MKLLKKQIILSLMLFSTFNPVFCNPPKSFPISPASKEQLSKEEQPSLLTRAIIGGGVSAAIAIFTYILGGATLTPSSFTIATSAGALAATFTDTHEKAALAAATTAVPTSWALLKRDQAQTNLAATLAANTDLTTQNQRLQAPSELLRKKGEYYDNQQEEAYVWLNKPKYIHLKKQFEPRISNAAQTFEERQKLAEDIGMLLAKKSRERAYANGLAEGLARNFGFSR